MQLYAFGVFFNLINWIMSVNGMTGSNPWFGEMGWRPVATIVFFAFYGLTISLILKQFGAIVS